MKTVDELNAIKNEYKNSIAVRTNDYDIRVVVGMGNSGLVAGARDVMKTLVEEIDKEGLSGKVIVTQEARVSRPGYNPVVCIVENHINTVTYINVTAEKAQRIVKEHIKGGKVVEEYVLPDEFMEEV